MHSCSVPLKDQFISFWCTTASLLMTASCASDMLKTPKDGTTKKRLSYGPSCRLKRVQLEDVVIGRCGEVELLLTGGSVVTGAVQPQRPLKVQELSHEVEVWGNVGLFSLDKVISVIEREVEPLHQVGHSDSD